MAMSNDEVTPTAEERERIDAVRRQGLDLKSPWVGDDGDIVVSAYMPIDESHGVTMQGWGSSVSDALRMLEERCSAAAKISESFKAAAKTAGGFDTRTRIEELGLAADRVAELFSVAVKDAGGNPDAHQTLMTYRAVRAKTRGGL
jgi:hypothetical protein